MIDIGGTRFRRRLVIAELAVGKTCRDDNAISAEKSYFHTAVADIPDIDDNLARMISCRLAANGRAIDTDGDTGSEMVLETIELLRGRLGIVAIDIDCPSHDIMAVGRLLVISGDDIFGTVMFADKLKRPGRPCTIIELNLGHRVQAVMNERPHFQGLRQIEMIQLQRNGEGVCRQLFALQNHPPLGRFDDRSPNRVDFDLKVEGLTVFQIGRHRHAGFKWSGIPHCDNCTIDQKTSAIHPRRVCQLKVHHLILDKNRVKERGNQRRA
ncbi:MAG: hypothetical protein ACD_75C02430G0002 [uncultured bacterium]|nr:MAG: hypothetical protein ACD_75C02430G0002 [uncultured bacterium]